MRQRVINAFLALQALSAAPTNAMVLGLAVFLWLAALAWLRPLSLPDEGRYVGVALEMLWSGNWLQPTLDTLPYFHKPPLFYWLTAASLGTFGINVWAARLGSLLAATGCALGLHHFLWRWSGHAHARVALLVLLTAPFFYGGAQFANLDMLVAACISGTILCAAHAVLGAPDAARPSRLALAGAYALAALGLLAKGLIGIVIPAIVIGIWLVFLGRAWMILRLVWLPGLALFAAIGLPWFLLMQARYPGFFEYFFVHHHFERFAAQGFNNPQPFWFLVVVFVALTLPWSAFLIEAARACAHSEPRGRSRQIQALMWIWLVSTLVFFSIPKSKLIGYVMVALPPLGALAAEGLLRAAGTQARTWAMRAAAGAVAICAAILIVVDVREEARDNTRQLAAQLRPLLTSPADPLVVLYRYPFSLPFYLGYLPPLRVVENWRDSRVMQRDTWRRELYEAAAFDPDRGKSLLLVPEDMPLLLACATRPMWLIVAGAREDKLPKIGLERVAQVGNDSVWRTMPPSGTPGDCAP
ncbi:MAG TPA: glycosyltransferase family 39 protein [Hyphomicrobiaceae bacterium]|jgi:4-amino-4-deoxy-L-arabinose transferase-like glycosyltransferase